MPVDKPSSRAPRKHQSRMTDQAAPLPPEPADCRVVYLALGPAYAAMCVNSIRTLRQHCPGIAVTVVTNIHSRPGDDLLRPDDEWICIERDVTDNRDIKTRIHEYTASPFNLYLDADTEVLGDLGPFFGMLRSFDIGLRLESRSRATGRLRGNAPLFGGSLFIGDLPHWNSGVILFRKNELAEGFFRTWNRRFLEMNMPFDQPSLVETIFESKARLLSFDYRWNARPSDVARNKLGKDALILHYMTRIDDDLRARILDGARKLQPSSEEMIDDVSKYIDARAEDQVARDRRLPLLERARRAVFRMKNGIRYY